MDESKARSLIIEHLRGRRSDGMFGYSSYGYDLYIPAVIFNYVTQGRHDANRNEAERHIEREYPYSCQLHGACASRTFCGRE